MYEYNQSKGEFAMIKKLFAIVCISASLLTVEYTSCMTTLSQEDEQKINDALNHFKPMYESFYKATIDRNMRYRFSTIQDIYSTDINDGAGSLHEFINAMLSHDKELKIMLEDKLFKRLMFITLARFARYIDHELIITLAQYGKEKYLEHHRDEEDSEEKCTEIISLYLIPAIIHTADSIRKFNTTTFGQATLSTNK